MFKKFFVGLAVALLAACSTPAGLGPNSPDVVAAQAVSQPENAIVVTSCGALGVLFLVDNKGQVRRIDSSSGIPYPEALALAKSAKHVQGVDAGCDVSQAAPRGHDGQANGDTTI
jgi:hypothetical protein